MSQIDQLITELSRTTAIGPAAPDFVGVVAGHIFTRPGGFLAFREQFQAAGLGERFDSWIGLKPTMCSINAAQIQDAMGRDDLKAIATQTGLDTTQVANALSATLPLLVRAITPSGALPTTLPNQLASLGRPVMERNGLPAQGTAFGLMTWPGPHALPRCLLALLVLVTLTYCGWTLRNRTDAPPAPPPAPAAEVTVIGT